VTAQEALDTIETALTDVFTSSSDEEDANFAALLALDHLRRVLSE